MTVAKQVSDVHTNLFFQMLVEKLITGGKFDAQIEKCCELYRHRRDLMLSLLSEKIEPGKAEWTHPDGGLFVWMRLPEGCDGLELCRIVKEKKLACVPGNAFCVDENAVSNGVRLNFSLPTDEQIIKGCDILAAAINEYVKL
jgi:2-aminoadipate transaminase